MRGRDSLSALERRATENELNDEGAWLRLADAHNGQTSGDTFVVDANHTLGVFASINVIDHDQAVITTNDQVALISH